MTTIISTIVMIYSALFFWGFVRFVTVIDVYGYEQTCEKRLMIDSFILSRQTACFLLKEIRSVKNEKN